MFYDIFKASYNRLSYLLRLYEFNEDDVILNGYTLTIPGQIGPLIKTCKEVRLIYMSYKITLVIDHQHPGIP